MRPFVVSSGKIDVPGLVRGVDLDPETKRRIMATGEEFRFKIDAYTPDTMPLERLAEYLAELAVLFGENKAVHFVRLEPGSTVPVIKVEREAAPKVRARVKSVIWGDATGEAMRAYRTINRKLREDNAVGAVQEATGAEIIRFPGREDEGDGFAAIRQQGTLDGEVIRIGGKTKIVPVSLQSEDQTFSYCYAKRALAKDLGRRLFEPVRLFGIGRWTRDRKGNWNLDNFIIDRFEVLSDDPLSSVLEKIRAIPGGEWGTDAIRELHDLRHGPDGLQ